MKVTRGTPQLAYINVALMHEAGPSGEQTVAPLGRALSRLACSRADGILRGSTLAFVCNTAYVWSLAR